MRIPLLLLACLALGSAPLGLMGQEFEGQLPDLTAEVQRSYLYTEFPGVRILSLDGRRETKVFAQAIAGGMEVFDELLPPRLRARQGRTFLVFLNPSFFEKFAYERSRPGVIRSARQHLLGDAPILMYQEPPWGTSAEEMVNHWDIEAKAEERQWSRDHGYHLPSVVRSPARSVTSDWASHFYGQSSEGLFAGQRTLPAWYRIALKIAGVRVDPESRRKVFTSQVPLTVPSTPGASDVRWLPLAQFFVAPVADPTQSTLLLYWGLSGDADHRARFMQLLDAACEQPIDEPLFQRCFGYGFAEADRRLWDFAQRTQALAGRTESLLGFLEEAYRRGAARPTKVRRATPDEVIRMVGEVGLWSEHSFYAITGTPPTTVNDITRYGYWPSPMSGNTAPENVARFAPSRRVIHDAARKGDPQMMALLGFYDLRMGNVAEGARWLQLAAAAKVQRPRVYADLAWLTLENALAEPKGPNGHPSRAQLQPAIDLLREGLRQMPEMRIGYVTLAYAWDSLGETPTAEELDLLVRAAHRYPNDLDAACAVALLCERAGRHQQALEIANRIVAAPIPTRSLRERLRSILQTSAAKS